MREGPETVLVQLMPRLDTGSSESGNPVTLRTSSDRNMKAEEGPGVAISNLLNLWALEVSYP